MKLKKYILFSIVLLYSNSLNCINISDRDIKEFVFTITTTLISLALSYNYSNIEYYIRNLFSKKKIKKTKKVVGYSKLRKKINFILENFIDEYKNKTYQKTNTEGIILYGPPGTGKTTIAVQLAEKLGLNVFVMSPGEIKSPYFSVTEKNLINFFKNALSKKPSIIIIDEIDELFYQGNISSSWVSQVENSVNKAIISFMEGVEDTSGVFIIATTNYLERIPKPLLRNGRFSHLIEVSLPNLQDRKEIITYYFNQYKIQYNDKSIIEYAALKTADFNNADIRGLCEYISQNQKKSKKILKKNYFNSLFLEKKYQKIVTYNQETIDEKSLNDICLHESGHAMLQFLFHLKNESLFQFDFVTINGADDSGGSSNLLDNTKLKFQTKNKLLNQIKIFFAGRLAQKMFGSGELDVGAFSDLSKATEIAISIITDYAMGNKKAVFKFNPKMIDEKKEIEELLQKEYDETEKLLEENKKFLFLIADELKVKKILYFEDLEKIYKNYLNNEKFQDPIFIKKNKKKKEIINNDLEI